MEDQKRNKRESGGIPKRGVCGAYNFYKMFQSISWWGNADNAGQLLGRGWGSALCTAHLTAETQVSTRREPWLLSRCPSVPGQQMTVPKEYGKKQAGSLHSSHSPPGSLSPCLEVRLKHSLGCGPGNPSACYKGHC